MPEPGDAAYLIDYLAEIGEAMVLGEGLAPITWRDVQAWGELAGMWLSPPEYKALLRLSRAYVAEYNRSDGQDCDMPHIRKLPSREDVEQKIKSLFAMLRRADDD